MVDIYIGPLPNPITGQSVAFRTLIDNVEGKKKVFNYAGYNTTSFIFRNISLLVLFPVYLFIYRREVRSVYFTSSRSTFGFLRDFFVVNVSKFFGLKIVNHLHGADFIKFRNSSRIKFLIDHTYNKIDTSIVLLEGMKEQYEIYPNMRVQVVPNCMGEDVEPFKNRELMVSSEHYRLLYLSNIMTSKGIFYLLEAVVILRKKGINITLDIAGMVIAETGESKVTINEKLMSYVDNFMFINYHGVVVGEKKQLLLEGSDIFVLPTFYETEAQPISIIEAMSYGCAIVTTMHNYLPTMIDELNGSLCTVKDVSSLQISIETLLDKDKLKKISNHNKIECKSTYSKEAYLESINNCMKG